MILFMIQFLIYVILSLCLVVCAYMCAILLVIDSLRYSWKRFHSSWVSAGHRPVPVFRILRSGTWHTWFLRRSWLSSLIVKENLALSPFLNSLMGTLDKEIFKAFKIPPKWFIRFLLELHNVLPNKSGLMNWIVIGSEKCIFIIIFTITFSYLFL